MNNIQKTFSNLNKERDRLLFKLVEQHIKTNDYNSQELYNLIFEIGNKHNLQVGDILNSLHK